MAFDIQFESPALTNSLKEIVRRYINEFRQREGRELEFFARLKDNPARAIEHACLALLPSGKRFSHQRRIPRIVLEEAHRRIASQNLKGCVSFHDLFLLVYCCTKDIKGYGELCVYDTSLRLGAFLNLEPEYIYLHAGTRRGAKALGINPKEVYVTKEELPKPFRSLKPREIEDCLCIYEDELYEISRGEAI